MGRRENATKKDEKINATENEVYRETQNCTGRDKRYIQLQADSQPSELPGKPRRQRPRVTNRGGNRTLQKKEMESLENKFLKD